MGSVKFGFNAKEDIVSDGDKVKSEFSIREKCRKIQKKLKKTDKKIETEDAREKKIWWNQCSSRKLYSINI